MKNNIKLLATELGMTEENVVRVALAQLYVLVVEGLDVTYRGKDEPFEYNIPRRHG